MYGPLLLDYVVSTSPQPLQIGTSARPAMGLVNIYVAEGKSVAYCKQILIAVKVGSDAGCLFARRPDGAGNTGKWAQSSFEIVPGESLGLGNGEYAKFTFDARDATDWKITYNLVFSLYGQVNDALGAYEIHILETSAPSPDGPFTDTSGTLTTTLAPPQFYLQNLVATQVGKPTVPCSEFLAGAPIALTWESNGTWFQLYKKGDPAPFWSGVETTASLSGGVTTDTTFILVAAMSGDPGQDAGGGFRPIVLYDALTMTISDPDLAAQSLKVSGATALAGVTMSGNLDAPSTVASIAELRCNDAIMNGDLRTPGTVAAGKIRTQEIDGDVVFKGRVTFEQDVVFGGQATFQRNATFNGQRVDFKDGTNVVFGGIWYLFTSPAANEMIFMNVNQQQIIYNEDGSIFSRNSAGSRNFFRDQDSCHIANQNRDGAMINATEKGPQPGDWCVATTYWKSKYHLDKDSNLTIYWGNAF